MATSDCSKLRRTIQALCLGAALFTAVPALADNLPEVQRLMKQGQYPQALEKVDTYLSTRPKDAQGRFLKGLILTEMSRPNDAIAIFTKLTEDYPELPEPYNNLAVLYAQQKQYDRARSALEMAIRTHPSYAIAYENLGDVYAKLASQAYDKALQLDSANSAAQNKLALIRDLVSTPVKPGSRPTVVASTTNPVPAAVTTPPSLPATPTSSTTKAPAATVITATPGAAATSPATPIVAMPTVEKEPAPRAAPSADPATEDVSKALAAWAAAWSRKDVKSYLAHYASDFKTPDNASRKEWEKEREARINKPAKIQVTYDEPKISIDGNRATVRFRQHYRASTFSSSSNKTLVFAKSGASWLILSEDSR